MGQLETQASTATLEASILELELKIFKSCS